MARTTTIRNIAVSIIPGFGSEKGNLVPGDDLYRVHDSSKEPGDKEFSVWGRIASGKFTRMTHANIPVAETDDLATACESALNDPTASWTDAEKSALHAQIAKSGGASAALKNAKATISEKDAEIERLKLELAAANAKPARNRAA